MEKTSFRPGAAVTGSAKIAVLLLGLLLSVWATNLYAQDEAPKESRLVGDSNGPAVSAIALGVIGKPDAVREIVPLTKTTVDVEATLNDVAQAQVQEQEKQRVLGLMPNFYSSYIWNAAPMTPKLKLQLSLRASMDPMTFLVAGALAGMRQARDTYPGYGQGSEGYAKRFGAAYTDATLGRMFSRAIFPVMLHQDPRYFYRGSGTIRSRIFYALAQSVVCRGDDGQLQPNYSQFLGSVTAAEMGSLYRAPGDHDPGLTLRHGLVIWGDSAIENLLREFLSRKLTPNVPAFANGRP